MDYEKKYKEALEWARKVVQEKVGFVLDEVLEKFPELAESEDEKLRKELLQIAKESEDSFYMVMTPNKREHLVTWLEKQSSNNIKWNKNTKDNKPQINHSVLMQTTHGISEGEWQGELWYQYRWSVLIRDSDVLSWIELSDIEKQGEQKAIPPIWKYKKDSSPLVVDSITLNKYGCVAKSPSGAIVSDVWVLDFNELAKLPKEEPEKQSEHKFCTDDSNK